MCGVSNLYNPLQDGLTVCLPRGQSVAPDEPASSQVGDMQDVLVRELQLWYLEQS